MSTTFLFSCKILIFYYKWKSYTSNIFKLLLHPIISFETHNTRRSKGCTHSTDEKSIFTKRGKRDVMCITELARRAAESLLPLKHSKRKAQSMHVWLPQLRILPRAEEHLFLQCIGRKWKHLTGSGVAGDRFLLLCSEGWCKWGKAYRAAVKQSGALQLGHRATPLLGPASSICTPAENWTDACLFFVLRSDREPTFIGCIRLCWQLAWVFWLCSQGPGLSTAAVWKFMCGTWNTSFDNH